MDDFNNQLYFVGTHKNNVLVTDDNFSKFWMLDDPSFLSKSPNKFTLPNVNLDYPQNNFFNYTNYSSSELLDAIILGIPFSSGSLVKPSYVNYFPNYLRKCSLSRPVYTSIDSLSASGIYDLNEGKTLFKNLKFQDIGNLQLTDNTTMDELNTSINNLLTWTLDHSIKTVAIGGDHSISYHLINTLSSKKNDPIIVLIFDAHHDCRNSLFIQDKDITHANFVRHLLKLDNVVKIIQIGLRGTRSFSQMIFDPKLTQISASCANSQTILTEIKDTLAKYPNAIGYLSIDLDVLDPCNFSYVDYAVPDGIPCRELIKYIKTIFQSQLIINGVDILEGLPNGDKEQYFIPLEILAHCLHGIYIQNQN